jgi:hypothetical protein
MWAPKNDGMGGPPRDASVIFVTLHELTEENPPVIEISVPAVIDDLLSSICDYHELPQFSITGEARAPAVAVRDMLLAEVKKIDAALERGDKGKTVP